MTAVTISPGFSVVLPGPRKKADSASGSRQAVPWICSLPSQNQAGSDGIAGRGSIAEVTGDVGTRTQLVAGHRAAGFCPPGMILLHFPEKR